MMMTDCLFVCYGYNVCRGFKMNTVGNRDGWVVVYNNDDRLFVCLFV